MTGYPSMFDSPFMYGDPGMNPMYGPYGMPFQQGPTDPWQMSMQSLQMQQPVWQPMQSLQPSANLGYQGPNIPGMGQFGPMLGSMANMMVGQYYRGQGYVPTNIFSPTGNLPTVLRNRQDMADMMAAMRITSLDERSIDLERMQGIGRAIARWGGADEATARERGLAWGQFANNMLTDPSVMMAINTAGSMMGMDILGMISPTRAMTQGVARMGMGVYRGDGQFGLTPEQNAEISTLLMQHYYPGGKLDVSRSRGFSAGQLGNMMAVMQRQGLMPGFMTEQEAVASGELRSDFGGDRAKALTDINAKHMQQRMGEMTKVFQLARELTGTDDMDKLLTAVQTLTGGGAGKMSASQIEQSMSRVQELVRTARITVDQMTNIIQQGSAIAERAGYSGQVGAAMGVNTVELATVMSASGARLFGGKDSPYNLSMNEFAAVSQQSMASTLTGPMFKRVTAMVGALQEIDAVHPGTSAALRSRLEAKKAAGTLTAGEATKLRLLEISTITDPGQFTPADYELLRSQQGQEHASQLLEEAGYVSGDARRALASRRLSDLGARINENLLPAINQNAQIAEAIRNITTNIVGHQAIKAATKGDMTAARKLAAGLAEWSVTHVSDTDDARESFAALMKQMNVTDVKTQDSLSAAVNLVRDKVALGPDATTAQVAHLQHLGHDSRLRSVIRESMNKNIDFWKQVRAQGGMAGFQERLIQFMMNDDAWSKEGFADLLGMIPEGAMKDALQKPLEELGAAKASLKGVISVSEKARLGKSIDQAKIEVQRKQAKLKEVDQLVAKIMADNPGMTKEEAQKSVAAQRDAALAELGSATSALSDLEAKATADVINDTEYQSRKAAVDAANRRVEAVFAHPRIVGAKGDKKESSSDIATGAKAVVQLIRQTRSGAWEKQEGKDWVPLGRMPKDYDQVLSVADDGKESTKNYKDILQPTPAPAADSSSIVPSSKSSPTAAPAPGSSTAVASGAKSSGGPQVKTMQVQGEIVLKVGDYPISALVDLIEKNNPGVRRYEEPTGTDVC